MIAALYVERGGAYWDMPGVDAWDADRDARRYAGTMPVVAHPPCQLWGAMAAVNYARWGGYHNKPGNDNPRTLDDVKCRIGAVVVLYAL